MLKFHIRIKPLKVYKIEKYVKIIVMGNAYRKEQRYAKNIKADERLEFYGY